MTIITSLQNPTVKFVRSLAQKKHRQEAGLFIAEGRDMLARARRENWAPETILSTVPEAEWRNATQLTVSSQVMAALSAQENATDIVGVFKQRYAETVTQDGLWLALEDTRDPGNLGTIIRTADAAGAKGIVLVGQGCDPFSPEAVRATTGSIFAVPIVKRDRVAFIANMKSWPGDIVATAMHAKEDFRRSYRAPAMLLMGSEGSGLSADLTAVATVSVRIPMAPGPESLNVAAAAALMLYEIAKPGA
jgi:RNA methyltransferase, TrmH family